MDDNNNPVKLRVIFYKDHVPDPDPDPVDINTKPIAPVQSPIPKTPPHSDEEKDEEKKITTDDKMRKQMSKPMNNNNNNDPNFNPSQLQPPLMTVKRMKHYYNPQQKRMAISALLEWKVLPRLLQFYRNTIFTYDIRENNQFSKHKYVSRVSNEYKTTLAPLEVNTTYSLQIKMFDAKYPNESSVFSNPLIIKTPTPPQTIPTPKYIQITSLLPQMMQVRWDPAFAPGKQQNIKYYIKEYLQFGKHPFVAQYGVPTGTLSPLKPNTQYKISIYTKELNSNQTTQESNQLSVTTPPSNFYTIPSYKPSSPLNIKQIMNNKYNEVLLYWDTPQNTFGKIHYVIEGGKKPIPVYELPFKIIQQNQPINIQICTVSVFNNKKYISNPIRVTIPGNTINTTNTINTINKINNDNIFNELIKFGYKDNDITNAMEKVADNNDINQIIDQIEKKSKKNSIYRKKISNHVIVARNIYHPLSYYVNICADILRVDEELYIRGLSNTMAMTSTLVEVLKRQRIAIINKISTGMHIDDLTQIPKAFIAFKMIRGEFAKFIANNQQRKIIAIFEIEDNKNEGTLTFQKIKSLQLALKFKANPKQIEESIKFLSAQNDNKLNLPSFIKYASILIHPLLKTDVFNAIIENEFILTVKDQDNNDGDISSDDNNDGDISSDDNFEEYQVNNDIYMEQNPIHIMNDNVIDDKIMDDDNKQDNADLNAVPIENNDIAIVNDMNGSKKQFYYFLQDIRLEKYFKKFEENNCCDIRDIEYLLNDNDFLKNDIGMKNQIEISRFVCEGKKIKDDMDLFKNSNVSSILLKKLATFGVVTADILCNEVQNKSDLRDKFKINNDNHCDLIWNLIDLHLNELNPQKEGVNDTAFI